MAKQQKQTQQENISKETYRLETDKRMFVIHYDGETYDIISGSRKGKVSKERRSPLETTNGRTPAQEALVQVAKLINQKIKNGYVPQVDPKYSDVDMLNERVSKINISAVDMKKVAREIERTKKAFDKHAKIAKEKEVLYKDAVKKMEELKELLK